MREIVTVVIGIIEMDGKYLLTKRYQPKSQDSHNKWQLPGGGLELNETLEECLRRELKEEVGIEIKIITQIPRKFEKIYKTKHLLLPCFICKPRNDNPIILLDKEASEYGWYTKEEIKQLDSLEYTYEAIEEAEKLLISAGERT